jgi:ribosomal-protein-alanine N-acetyltransferase
VSLILRPVASEPQLFDPAVTGQFAQQMAELARTPQVPPWCGYIGWSADVPLGFGGFVAVPDDAGTVEIGYLTFPANEGQGVASAVAAGLVEIARANGLGAVIAHTLAQENASTTVLRRNQFVRDGEAQDPDEGTVWRWRLNLG